MISLNDYLYSGNTLFRIIHTYAENLSESAGASGNVIDRAHCVLLSQIQELLEHNDFLTDQSAKIREFYQYMCREYPYLAFTFRGRIKSLIRAEEKFNGYVVETISEYYRVNGTVPELDGLVKRLTGFRDLIAYRIVISTPKCRLRPGESKKERDLSILYEIANVLPRFLEERGFRPQISGNVEAYSSPLMNEDVRPYYKDYVVNRKKEGYQSLHITFFDEQVQSYFEIQLRTKDMDDHAEIGMANHEGYEQRQMTVRAQRGAVPEGACIYFDEAYERLRRLQNLDLSELDVNMFAAVNNSLINDGCGLYRGRLITPFEHLSRFQTDSAPYDKEKDAGLSDPEKVSALKPEIAGSYAAVAAIFGENEKTDEEYDAYDDAEQGGELSDRQKRKREKQFVRLKEKLEKKADRLSMDVNYSGEEVAEWDMLDNTAHLFPAVAGQYMTNVYRMSVLLKEEINPRALNKAINQVLPYFKNFHSMMRKGFFWYYFEENRKKFPRVQEEKDIPCRYFPPNSNRDYLFRVCYYRNKINLEVFHVLSDGYGGMQFFRELVCHYLRIVHPELKKYGEKILPDTSLNTEDAYLENYRKVQEGGYSSSPAYRIRGERLKKHMTGLIHGKMPLDQVKEIAHEYHCSINEYLVAAFIYSIYTEDMLRKPHKRPVSVAVPVNLRPYYDSDTLKNFFVMIAARFQPSGKEHTFEDVVRAVKESLRPQLNRENLENIFSFAVAKEKNLMLRMVPHAVKGTVMKTYYKGASRNTTATMTNVGSFRVPEVYEPYIEDYWAFLSRSYGQDIKGLISSYRNTLTVTFSSALADTAIQKGFYRQLADDGIDISIVTNEVYYNPAYRKRQKEG